MQATTLSVGDPSAAATVREKLGGADVFAINLVGGNGCGKTTLIEATLDRLPHLRAAVVASNVQPRRDGGRLAHYFDHIVPVSAPSLSAEDVAAAIGELSLDGLDLLFIESSPGPGFPVDLDLGQDVRVGVFSVSGGDDKAAKKPEVVREADAVVLTKLDLMPYVPFDSSAFRGDVRRINASAELIELSALREQHVDRWIDWLESRRRQAGSRRRRESDMCDPLPEWFFG